MRTIIKHQKGATEVEVIYQKDMFILHKYISDISNNWNKKYTISIYNAKKEQHAALMWINNWKLGRKIINQIDKTLFKDEKNILSTEYGENLKPIFEKFKPLIYKYFRDNAIPFYINRKLYRHSSYNYCCRE